MAGLALTRPRPAKRRRCACMAPALHRKKFARLDAQQVDGVLRGQYRFAGAGQTGRMSQPRGADSESYPRCARRGWRRGSAARRCDRRWLQLRRPGRGGPCRRAGRAQAGPPRASRPHCRAGKSVRLVGLVGDRGADHALARRVARRRKGPRYLPRQRSRPVAAGHLHHRRRRHPAQGAGRDNEDGTADRQGGAILRSVSAARSARCRAWR